MKNNKGSLYILKWIFVLSLLAFFSFVVYGLAKNYIDKGSSKNNNLLSLNTASSTESNSISSSSNAVPHVSLPKNFRGIYASSYVFTLDSLTKNTYNLFSGTELNAIIIDVKDSSGVITFNVNDPVLQKEGVFENRIKNIDEVIKYFHNKNIYVIARVAVFQDPGAAKKYPERAIKSKKDGTIWKDGKGLSWVDAGNRDQWDYVAKIAQYAYSIGFDEINFDYIRFPSDGNLKSMYLPNSEGKNKNDVVNSFYEFIGKKMRDEGIPTSADIFGQVTTDDSGLGIGQRLSSALKNFDHISPMSYPSHFAKGYHGIKDPNSDPYNTILLSYKDGLARIDDLAKSEATTVETVGTTTKNIIDQEKFNSSKNNYIEKLRPFLQDFSLNGVTYGEKAIAAQTRALEELGIHSYVFWNPSSKYTRNAFIK